MSDLEVNDRNNFDGLKIFSATMAKERAELGDVITRWIVDHADVDIVDRLVRQSSGGDYHCLTILLFFRSKRG
ncbi:MAG: hypothetical protein HYY84_17440 [Deltaproteobacteria bacterium]|nr:hypothetical protein [Deltaproteobacteria bacterium]